MHDLITIIKQIAQNNNPLPFSIYSSVKEQHILNVPIYKPLLIMVLNGRKKIGTEYYVEAGEFVFLSNTPSIDMRNIPDNTEYFALLIEFEFNDFNCFTHKNIKNTRNPFIQGKIDPILIQNLKQFIEWAAYAPPDIYSIRRQEILLLLNHLGHQQVQTIIEPPCLSHKIFNMIHNNIAEDLTVTALSTYLAMSESTLRRKLKAEGTSIQNIKDKARLGYGLHLVQTSFKPIGHIAEQCGYTSQSRFTDKFKKLFNITPTALRKTRMPD